MKTFEMKTVIHFGENSLERLKEIPYQRVLIITDPFVVQSKMIDLITEPLQRGGKEYDIFHNVVPDAPVDKIADGVKKFLSFQPEVIVAVGGGSAIDSSKAIREFAHNNGNTIRGRSADRHSYHERYRIGGDFFCSYHRPGKAREISVNFR